MFRRRAGASFRTLLQVVLGLQRDNLTLRLLSVTQCTYLAALMQPIETSCSSIHLQLRDGLCCPHKMTLLWRRVPAQDIEPR